MRPGEGYNAPSGGILPECCVAVNARAVCYVKLISQFTEMAPKLVNYGKICFYILI
jgi:hypothetical protein